MNLIRPTTPKVDIVEVAKNAPRREERADTSAAEVKAPQVESAKPRELGEFGKDYGLVFTADHDLRIISTRDGKKVETLLSGGNYESLFLDGDHMYYSRENSVFSWPATLERTFARKVYGLARHHGEIIVAVRDGTVQNLSGETRSAGLCDGHKLAALNGELYHVEGIGGMKGLVKTSSLKAIYQTGAWAGSVCELDGKLYFGGHDQKIYSYDGNRVRMECASRKYIWSVCGVREARGRILYVGGPERGIYRYDLDKRNGGLMLDGSVSEVGSIVAAPLDLIDKLAREAKEAKQ